MIWKQMTLSILTQTDDTGFSPILVYDGIDNGYDAADYTNKMS